MLGELLGALTGSRTNLLLIFLPLAIGLELAHASETWVFIAAALSIVPLASLIGEGTEAVATRVGPGIGGLLNATFGNGAELLIAGFALEAGLVDVVKASVAGSILGNTLLGRDVPWGPRAHLPDVQRHWRQCEVTVALPRRGRLDDAGGLRHDRAWQS
jgi:hypothetical protein